MKTTGSVSPTATITPAGAPAGQPRTPSRAELKAARVTMLRRGSDRKADVYRATIGADELVIKDYAARSLPWRLLGRLQLRRELAAYRRLAGLAGLPVCLGRVDRDALALEWIRGEPLKTLPDRVTNGPRYVGQLTEIVDGIHARGVVHLDLRSNNNVVVRDDRRVFVVDLASAVRLRPGSLLHRLLFRWLATLDRSGLLKWKCCLTPEAMRDEDTARLRRHRWLSGLWVVNPKQKPEPGEAGQSADVSGGSDGA